MTKSTGDLLPVHKENLPIPTQPNQTLLFLSTSRRTRAIVLRTRAVVLENEVELGETRTTPAVANIYPSRYPSNSKTTLNHPKPD